MAAEALALAENADPNTRVHFTTIADGWISLAEEVERDYFSRMR